MAPSQFSVDLKFKFDGITLLLPVTLENQFDVLYFGLQNKHDFTLVANTDDSSRRKQTSATITVNNSESIYGCNVVLTDKTEKLLKWFTQELSSQELNLLATYEQNRFHVNFNAPEHLSDFSLTIGYPTKETINQLKNLTVIDTLDELINFIPPKNK